jgi:hypothetical protein
MILRRFCMWALLPLVASAAAATLSVTSTPAGAALSVDGTPLGRETPATVEGLPAGPHAVALTLAGHQPVFLQVQLSEDAPLTLPVTLVPVGRAALEVIASPATASLHLDGAPVGAGTARFPALAAGPHELRVDAPGHATAERRFVLEPGDARTIRVALDPLPAAPTARSATAGARRGWGLSAVAVGSGLLGASAAQWATARAAWADYAAAVDDGSLTRSRAREVYAADVRPPRNRALALGGAGGVLLGAGLVLSL